MQNYTFQHNYRSAELSTTRSLRKEPHLAARLFTVPTSFSSVTMERLPPELVRCILEHCMRLSRSNKNELMKLRLVCKQFDAILREYVCKTAQLEFSRLVRGEPTPDTLTVPTFGHLVQALHCDMMVIRDQGMSSCPSVVYIR